MKRSNKLDTQNRSDVLNDCSIGTSINSYGTATVRRFRWEFRESHSISSAWLTFNRHRDSNRCLSASLSLSLFVVFSAGISEKRPRTRTSYLVASLVHRTWSARIIYMALSLSFPHSLPSSGRTNFPRFLILMARGKCWGATHVFSIASCQGADAVSHMHELFFLVTLRISVGAKLFNAGAGDICFAPLTPSWANVLLRVSANLRYPGSAFSYETEFIYMYMYMYTLV